ncbi:hypothetical protein [Kaarinaea lacus]
MVELAVSKIEGDQLTVDANHPFAGKIVKFCNNVVNVRKATNAELAGSVSPDTGTLQ